MVKRGNDQAGNRVEGGEGSALKEEEPGNEDARDPTSSSEGSHGQDQPPPQCRWGAFENPQFKWVPETLEGLKDSSKESKIGSLRV
jgi:hypothetical protein